MSSAGEVATRRGQMARPVAARRGRARGSCQVVTAGGSAPGASSVRSSGDSAEPPFLVDAGCAPRPGTRDEESLAAR